VTAHQPDPAPGAEPERGFALAVFAQDADIESELRELRDLARTARVEIVSELVQRRSQPDRRSYVGKGKLGQLERAFAASGAEALIVDDEISPVQQRTLENALEVRVVDRTQLILDIFAQHARSAEGKLQVELAQLEYNLPRMRGMWKHLERLGGGLGTRGPGESQLESDRRLARRRIQVLKKRLAELSKRRETGRKERRRTDRPQIALAGYTNAGKSTLLNALAGADVSVEDRLFETLDPTTRAFEEEGRRYLVTDTVGFIRRLPHQLVEGFAATLEETLVSDLVLHVADASLPPQELADQIAAVTAVLHEIGADELPLELVLNKVDEVDPVSRRRLSNRYPDAPQISALKGDGLDELRARLASRFAGRFEPVQLFIPHDQASALSELYELGPPIEERRDEAEGVFIRARLSSSALGRFSRFVLSSEERSRQAR
jgi:GTP-binding protein HflX